MIVISRGDVIIVDLTGAQGHESLNDPDLKARLCLVIQNDRGNAVSPTTIVAPITDVVAFKGLPVQVDVRGTDKGPLHNDSSIECGQIRTIDRDVRVRRVIGSLSAAVMLRVDAAIRVSLHV